MFHGRLVGVAGFSRTVALKLIDPRWVEAHGGARAFMERARELGRVRHPNVVPTLDAVMEEEEQVYLVAEYVPGETLDRLLAPLALRGERVPPRIACALVAGILRGLHAAHEARASRGEPLGIVHGDVSPRNVLVGADGVPRLLDFAFPRPTLPYVAPEQAHGDATPRTDVFGAGMILWEALTGRSALFGEGDADTVDGHDVTVVEAPSRLVLGVPREVDVITLRALRRDPNERYASAKDMARDLEACIGGSADSEIATWVEACAGPELARRAAAVAAIEHAGADDETEARHVAPALAMPVPASTSKLPKAPLDETMRAPREEVNQGSAVQLLAFAFIGFAVVAVAGFVALIVRANSLSAERAPTPNPAVTAGDASHD